MTITQETLRDIPGVLALLKANHADNVIDKANGFVTTNMNEEQMTALIELEQGVTVAKNGEKIIAFALAVSWKFWSMWPFFTHMIEELPTFNLAGQPLTTANSYQYGPVCVDSAYRGKGVFEQVFTASLAHMRKRYPLMVTFINQMNPRYYAAHTRKVGMREVGRFDYNQNHYYLMACSTNATDQSCK